MHKGLWLDSQSVSQKANISGVLTLCSGTGCDLGMGKFLTLACRITCPNCTTCLSRCSLVNVISDLCTIYCVDIYCSDVYDVLIANERVGDLYILLLGVVIWLHFYFWAFYFRVHR